MRPEVGTQAQFKKKLPPKKYRYDDSLSPALEWDGQNPARERGEALIREILEAPKLEKAKAAASKLKAMSKPFLNWAGKAERLSFDVPTLPLFIHERLSTKAILETLKGHRFDRNQTTMFDLWGDPQHPIHEQVLRAYEHKDKWVNRMILGDSLVVMNSLLQYESLGGQVQMIYIDPPYGVKFGSNFQPFVRKRDVSHGDDEDMTREPEMVQAYRDTWELGLHSYLTYLRDRLILAKDLMHPSGSVFVQISDENVHHVRELMDETFGAEHFVSQITFQKSSGRVSDQVDGVYDVLLWYARDRERMKFRKVYRERSAEQIDTAYNYIDLDDGRYRPLTAKELDDLEEIPDGARRFRPSQLYSQTGGESSRFAYEFGGREYSTLSTGGWRTNKAGLDRLANADRLMPRGHYLAYKMYADDFPFIQLHNIWTDVLFTSFGSDKLYVVQTSPKVIQRCILMTTNPGDLVLDPTCGSGTTAFCAEQWGRRWITIDTSRVPLALARQRLLTATYPWYELKEENRGPAGGFVYRRKQNNKGEEIGGIVPHVTLKSIANNEPPEEEVLVDKPEPDNSITRVTGPFTFEATIPTPMDWEEDKDAANLSAGQESYGSYVERMIEVLRRSALLRLAGNKSVQLRNVRPPAKTLSLSAEAMVDATALGNGASLADAVREAKEKNGEVLPLSQKAVAIVFGPENGAVSEKLVWEAAKEANGKGYAHLFVIGFSIQPHARTLIEKCAEAVGVAATYVQATPDLMMKDLLKNMRSSQIFSVCGLPEIAVRKVQPSADQIGANPRKSAAPLYEVELLGMDVFDPATMEADHRGGNDVPAWFLDTDYNGLCFRVSQAFFPRTGAWESLKKALRGEYEESVWDHLAGTTSAPFEAGEHRQIAVKVIDDRGNELLVVEKL